MRFAVSNTPLVVIIQVLCSLFPTRSECLMLFPTLFIKQVIYHVPNERTLTNVLVFFLLKI